MDLHEIKKHLKKHLDKERFEHTKGVMYTAGCLAMAHGYSIEDAMLAGLLHDCAKCISPEEQLKLCKKNNIEVNASERENLGLLHAKLGAFLAKEKYNVTDENILHAIKVHTTGEPDMNMLDKIIYIADYIEPGRYKAGDLDEVRKLAFKDLDKCMAKILSDTLTYLNERGGTIDPMTEQTYNFYKGKRNK